MVVRTTPKLLILSLLSAGTALAQPAAPPATPPRAVRRRARPRDVDVSVKQRANLSPQEMLGQGKDYFRVMNETLGHIQTLQETARRQKDIIKLNCVTDKLVQAKVNINIAEQAMTTLQESIARADEGGRTHEFTRLTIVNQKVLVLGTEAENCIGEDSQLRRRHARRRRGRPRHSHDRPDAPADADDRRDSSPAGQQLSLARASRCRTCGIPRRAPRPMCRCRI